MKKKLLVLSALALAGASTIVSCGKQDTPTTPSSESSQQVTITGITVEGQTSTYGIGDKAGKDNAKVYVNYSDGSKKDYTASATFDYSKVDTSKAGTYTVTVSCSGKTTTFTVEVKNDVLDSVVADADSLGTFTRYATPSFDSVKVSAVYKNAVSGTSRSVAVENKDVSFVIKNSKGEVVTCLTELGTYTVTATYREKSVDFEIVCASVIASTVSDAVASAVAHEDTVNSGSYKYHDEDYSISKTYRLGENYVRVTEDGAWYDDYTKFNHYYSVDKNGDAFAVSVGVKNDGTEDKNSATKLDYDALGHAPNAKDAKAVGFDILNSGEDEYVEYGFGNSINTLYQKYKESIDPNKSEAVGALTNIKDKDGKAVNGFKFSFNYVVEKYSRAYFKTYNVEFVLNDNGAVSEAYIEVKEYVSEDKPYQSIEKIKTDGIAKDLGIELVTGTDSAGAEQYSFKFVKHEEDKTYVDARVSSYTVSQTSGLKYSDDETEYLASKQTIASFDAYVVDGDKQTVLNDGDTFDIDLDNATEVKNDKSHYFAITLKVGNILPTTITEGLDEVKVVVTGNAYDETAVDSKEYEGESYAYVSSLKDNGTRTLWFYRAGTYKVTFSSANVTKTVTYNVQFEAPTSLNASVYNGVSGDFATVDTFDCYTTNTIYVDAIIEKYFTQGYTASVKVLKDKEYVDVDPNTVTLEETKTTVNGKEVSCYKFNASIAGTYKITLTGAKPDNDQRTAATTDVVVNVSAVPSIDDILKGKYDYAYEATVSSSEIYKVKFEKTAEDASTGTVTFTRKYDSTKVQTGTFTVSNGQLVITTSGDTLGLADNAEFSVYIDAYYNLYIVNSVTETKYVLNKPTSDISDAAWAALKRSYTGGDYTFKFVQGSEKGEGTVTITTASTSSVYSFKYDDTTAVIALTLVSGDDVFNGYSISVKDGVLTCSKGNDSFELAVKGPNLNEICSGDYTVVDCSNISYTIKFADGKVTIKKPSKNRERVCTYEYDEETGQLKLTMVSGSDSSVGLEDYLYIIDGKLSYKGLTMNSENKKVEYVATCLRAGDSGEESTPEIPSNYHGTWYGYDSKALENADGNFTVTISSTEVVVEGDDMNGTYTVISVSGSTVTAKNNWVTITLTLGNNSISYDYSSSYITATLSKNAPVTLDTTLIGTWNGIDPESEKKFSIKVESNTLTYDGSSYTLEDYTDGRYHFKAKDDYNAYLYKDTLGDIYFVNEENDPVKMSATETVVPFTEEYLGTWHDNSNQYAIIITTNSIKVNNVEGTNISKDSDGVYIFDIGDVTYNVWFENNTDQLTYVPDNTYDQSKRVTLSRDILEYLGLHTFTGRNYSDNEVSFTYKDGKIVYTEDDDYTYKIESKDNNVITTNDDGWYHYTLTYNNGSFDVVQYVTAGDKNDTYTISRESSDSSDSDAVTFSEEYQHTWINTSNNADTVVITATTVTYKNLVYTDVEYEDDAYTAWYTNIELTVYLKDGVLYISQGRNKSTYILDGVAPETSGDDDSSESTGVIPSSWCGTWTDDDAKVELFLGSTSLSVTVNTVDKDGSDLTYTDGTLSFTVDGTTATVTQSGDNLIYSIDGTSYTLTKVVND